jgi:hypothetical protein
LYNTCEKSLPNISFLQYDFIIRPRSVSSNIYKKEPEKPSLPAPTESGVVEGPQKPAFSGQDQNTKAHRHETTPKNPPFFRPSHPWSAEYFGPVQPLLAAFSHSGKKSPRRLHPLWEGIVLW